MATHRSSWLEPSAVDLAPVEGGGWRCLPPTGAARCASDPRAPCGPPSHAEVRREGEGSRSEEGGREYGEQCLEERKREGGEGGVGRRRLWEMWRQGRLHGVFVWAADNSVANGFWH